MRARLPILQWFEPRWEKHDLINLFFDQKVFDKAATDPAGRGIHRGALRFFFANFLISLKRTEGITVPLPSGEEAEDTEDSAKDAHGHLTVSAEAAAGNNGEFQRIWQAANILLVDPTSWDFALGIVPATVRTPVARWLRFAMHFNVCREHTGENADVEYITSRELAQNIGMRSYAYWSRRLGIAPPQDPTQRIAVLRDSLLGLWIANVLGVPVEPQNFDEISRIMRILCEVALHLDPDLLT